MKSQDDIFFEAYVARDPRFDGKFFTAVKSTGIYCRPICPAKPKRENVEFFADAYSAEKAGYRPCLRCRPECAPMSPAWMGRSAVVQRALKLISQNERFDSDENRFAAQFGISARHLRRLFEQELGKSPKQISDTHRLNFARVLIVETHLPITEIAFSSGFSSIRRFNDAFKLRFHRNPRELRAVSSNKNLNGPGAPLQIQLKLPYRPPFDWNSLIQFYRSHQMNGIEEVTDQKYQRVFRINTKINGDLSSGIGAFALTHQPDQHSLCLEVASSDTSCLYTIVQRARQMFDLDCDPLTVSESLAACSVLGRLCADSPGLRLPRGFDPFEVAIATILGQLVSTEQARRLVQQLVQNYGEKITNPLTGNDAFLFPTVEVLATQPLDKVGTTKARKESIREFSKLVQSKKLLLHSAQDPVLFRKNLLAIKGIGPWSAEYISLRALGDTNAFPGSDLILKRVLAQHPQIRLEDFSPWRAYAAIYLWKEFAASLSGKTLKKEKKNVSVPNKNKKSRRGIDLSRQ